MESQASKEYINGCKRYIKNNNTDKRYNNIKYYDMFLLIVLIISYGTNTMAYGLSDNDHYNWQWIDKSVDSQTYVNSQCPSDVKDIDGTVLYTWQQPGTLIGNDLVKDNKYKVIKWRCKTDDFNSK